MPNYSRACIRARCIWALRIYRGTPNQILDHWVRHGELFRGAGIWRSVETRPESRSLSPELVSPSEYLGLLPG